MKLTQRRQRRYGNHSDWTDRINRIQESGESLSELIGAAELTFPDDHYFPAHGEELTEGAAVTIAIAAAFGLPEGGVGLRDNAAVSTAMQVPETAVKGTYDN